MIVLKKLLGLRFQKYSDQLVLVFISTMQSKQR